MAAPEGEVGEVAVRSTVTRAPGQDEVKEEWTSWYVQAAPEGALPLKVYERDFVQKHDRVMGTNSQGD